MPPKVWLEIRDNNANMLGLANVHEGSWSLELRGGCGDASFTLAREWSDISDLATGRHIRVKVDGVTYWDGIIQRLVTAAEQPPRIECVGHKERLKRLGQYHREWVTTDLGTPTTQPTLNLDDHVAIDVMSRLSSLFSLSTSQSIPDKLVASATLDGDGYAVMEGLADMFEGNVTWGVDEARTLYLLSFPSVVADDANFVYGKNMTFAASRDDTQLLNKVILQGSERTPPTEKVPATFTHWGGWMLSFAGRQEQLTPAFTRPGQRWNLLPNATFENRRADVATSQWIGAGLLTAEYFSWPNLDVLLDGVSGGLTAVKASGYDPASIPGKAGETALKAMISATTSQGSVLRIATASPPAVPVVNDDGRIEVVPGMTITLCAAIYLAEPAPAPLMAWSITTYNADNSVVQDMVVGEARFLAQGWNTWDDSMGGLVGTDTSASVTLGTGAVVKARIMLSISMSPQADITRTVYVDAWQMMSGTSQKPFSPGLFPWQSYTADQSAMSQFPSEITQSSTNYGLHFDIQGAAFKDDRIAADADGVLVAQNLFWNRATPFWSGTIEYFGEPKLLKPWQTLLRVHGLPTDVHNAIKRFSSETFADLQADRVEYGWDGELSMKIQWSNKRVVIAKPIVGYPTVRKDSWRGYLEDVSRHTSGPLQYQRRQV